MTWTPEQSAVWTKRVYDDLRGRGHDAEAAIKACGIGRVALNKRNGTIPFDKHCALLEYAATTTGDDLYGLHLGAQTDPRDIGLIGYIGLSSATLHDAFDNFRRYASLVSDVAGVRLEIVDDLAIVSGKLKATLPPPGYGQECEYSISVFVRACQIFTDTEIVPVKIRFLHHRGAHKSDVERLLGCPVTFGSGQQRVVFERQNLSLPIVSADDNLLDILKGYGDAILAERSKRGPDFKHQVEGWIVALLPKGQASAKTVAMQMGMSERTLSRRLADMGLTFKSLLAEVRHQLALKYVAEPGINLKQAAFLLGYTEVSTFSHAFKRWTGQTPASARQTSIGS